MNECYSCQYRRDVPGDAHSSCAATWAKVKGDAHGIRSGWFFWPFNYDPTWLVSCDVAELIVKGNQNVQNP
jgi:hypothetical protein